ncbi:hypothetical protein CEXT_429831 [Caerostris extrusa]|uniref:Uncharacterized protein n=1 Tax=Caerostris extrusa TaxID=172846 RepID=A0AAV4PY21_CAEEX|nr:hypothetical protein CEXT_429831 [Caerostris extrusa]
MGGWEGCLQESEIPRRNCFLAYPVSGCIKSPNLRTLRFVATCILGEKSLARENVCPIVPRMAKCGPVVKGGPGNWFDNYLPDPFNPFFWRSLPILQCHCPWKSIANYYSEGVLSQCCHFGDNPGVEKRPRQTDQLLMKGERLGVPSEWVPFILDT